MACSATASHPGWVAECAPTKLLDCRNVLFSAGSGCQDSSAKWNDACKHEEKHGTIMACSNVQQQSFTNGGRKTVHAFHDRLQDTHDLKSLELWDVPEEGHLTRFVM